MVSIDRLIPSTDDALLALTSQDFDPILFAFGIGVMINKDSRGHSYFIARVSGAIYLVNSINEGDLSLLTSYAKGWGEAYSLPTSSSPNASKQNPSVGTLRAINLYGGHLAHAPHTLPWTHGACAHGRVAFVCMEAHMVHANWAWGHAWWWALKSFNNL
ncbi:putative rRNA intron-encoded homing endonuclease [Cucumis melo var. makuwa]|uniref:rRNA intron-encoded homing endonuclease n=1 Tax=Cucumis melo var. makuwa TaxID=1194695 RepID=A0A5D3D2R8_CUCMM|nr:putative rRNA intron-encoded homing endonuclease [Cucumis melo var. makuwa]TYK18065.1 putative rRNA intron-encoded homing endonuclease [Cucumis melo var. makuwa]